MKGDEQKSRAFKSNEMWNFFSSELASWLTRLKIRHLNASRGSPSSFVYLWSIEGDVLTYDTEYGEMLNATRLLQATLLSLVVIHLLWLLFLLLLLLLLLLHLLHLPLLFRAVWKQFYDGASLSWISWDRPPRFPIGMSMFSLASQSHFCGQFWRSNCRSIAVIIFSNILCISRKLCVEFKRKILNSFRVIK